MTPDDLAKILDELGQRLGPTGQAAWMAMVTQKTNEAHAWLGFYGALSNVLLALIGFVFFGTLVVFFFERYGPWKPHNSHEDDMAPSVVFVLVFLGMAWGFAQFQLIQTGLQAQNPTYYALHELLAAVHP